MMLIAFMISSAVFASNQTVVLQSNRCSIQQLVDAIEEQTGMSVDFNQKTLDPEKSVTLKSKKSDLKDLLDELSEKESVECRMSGRHIIITKKESSHSKAVQQQEVIRGSVIDAATQEPIIGATIAAKEGSARAVSDINGNFSISVAAGTPLEITYIGYKKQEVKASQGVRILLQEDATVLNDVVVVGYGTKRRVNVSGAISTADDQVFSSRSVTDATTALQGEIPGLTVIRNGGNVDDGTTLRVRDISSVNGGSPLVIIDGAVGDLSLINPADIKDISVLKDGTAAIYGARASDGVILITTKGGSMNQPIRVDFDANIALKTPALVKEAASLYEDAVMMLEVTDGSITPCYSEDDLELIKQGSDRVDLNSQDFGRWNGYPKFYKDQDWNDMIIGNGFQTNYNVKVSGGGNRFNFMVSLGFQREKGLPKYGKDFENRYFVRTKASALLLKNLKYDANISYEAIDRDYSTGLDTNEGQNIWELIWKEHRWTPLRNPAGNFYTFEGFDNPAQVLEEGGFSNKTSGNYTFNNQLTWTPIKGLDIIGMVVVRKYDYDKDVKSKIIYSYNWENVNHRTARTPNYAYRQYYKTLYHNYTLYANYKHTFAKKHSIDAMIGASHESEDNDSFYAKRINFTQQENMSLNLGSTDNQDNSSSGYAWTINSVFGRLNYSFENRYIIEGTLRTDGSSRFAEGHRWGWFPGVNGAWRITEEPFMRNQKLFTDLKIRASYGEMGNQSGIGYYDYIPLISYTTNYYPFGDGVKGQMANCSTIVSEDRTWETIKTTNIGLDFSMLNDRLYGSFDYFWKHNDNMLIPITYPSLLGATAPATNSGKLRVHGWDVTLGWRDKVGEFHYDISVNVSDSKNKVVSRIGSNLITLGLNSTPTGYPINSYFGYVFDGLIQTEEQLEEYKQRFSNGGIPDNLTLGDAMYKDLDGDGVLSVLGDGKEGSGDVKYLGDRNPRYNFGINFRGSWRGIDCTIFFQGVGKRTMFLEGDAAMPGAQPWYASDSYWYGKTWTADRTDAKYPAITYSDKKNYNYSYSDNTAFKVGYIRLKNLQVGYTFPKELISKLKIQKLRVYFSGEDLWEYTDGPDNWDPEENGYYNSYPFTRNFTIGVNLSF